MEKRKNKRMSVQIIGILLCLSLLFIPSIITSASEDQEKVVQEEMQEEDQEDQEELVEKQKHGSALGIVFGVIIAIVIIFGTIFATKGKLER